MREMSSRLTSSTRSLLGKVGPASYRASELQFLPAIRLGRFTVSLLPFSKIRRNGPLQVAKFSFGSRKSKILAGTGDRER